MTGAGDRIEVWIGRFLEPRAPVDQTLETLVVQRRIALEVIGAHLIDREEDHQLWLGRALLRLLV